MPPPLPKIRGAKGSEKSLGDDLVSQNDDLQSVKHPISIVAVCYMNTPPKGGGGGE